MDNSKQWFDFIELANAVLMQGQKIDNYKPNIQIAFEPSFDNHVFLQLQWDNEILNWYRTTWHKLIDEPKFNDPIESLKYIGQSLHPTIKRESGSTDLNKIKHIIDFAKSISIKPNSTSSGDLFLMGVITP